MKSFDNFLILVIALISFSLFSQSINAQKRGLVNVHSLTTSGAAAKTELHIIKPLLTSQQKGKDEDGKITVLAIDMDKNGQVTVEGVLKGRDAVLLLSRERSNRPPKAKTLYYFKHFDDLALLDDNRDGRIDFIDISARRLYALYLFGEGERYRILFWSLPGIRALFLDSERVTQVSQNPSDGFRKVAKEAVMADGSRRKIAPVEIDSKYFERID